MIFKFLFSICYAIFKGRPIISAFSGKGDVCIGKIYCAGECAAAVDQVALPCIGIIPDLAFEIYYDLKSASHAALLSNVLTSKYFNKPFSQNRLRSFYMKQGTITKHALFNKGRLIEKRGVKHQQDLTDKKYLNFKKWVNLANNVP